MASNSCRSPDSETLNIPQPDPEPLNIHPLTSMPYVTTMAHSDGDQEDDSKVVEGPKPALVFFPSQPTAQQFDDILSVKSDGVCLTGSAAYGTYGPLMGKRDIGEDDESYLFRVSLPGVAKEDFSCDISPDGKIVIKGITTAGEKAVFRNAMRFEMVTQNLPPPGPFSISFNLPGPVDSENFTSDFGMDGILEVVVKKATAAN